MPRSSMRGPGADAGCRCCRRCCSCRRRCCSCCSAEPLGCPPCPVAVPLQPAAVIVDSIQTVYLDEVSSSAGSVVQVGAIGGSFAQGLGFERSCACWDSKDVLHVGRQVAETGLVPLSRWAAACKWLPTAVLSMVRCSVLGSCSPCRQAHARVQSKAAIKYDITGAQACSQASQPLHLSAPPARPL